MSGMTFIKWIFGLAVASVAAYMLFIVLNTMIQNKKKPRSFPCTYISGKCTVKPTSKNCSGGEPISYCEMRLNNRLK
jgi:hypothetical protein